MIKHYVIFLVLTLCDAGEELVMKIENNCDLEENSFPEPQKTSALNYIQEIQALKKMVAKLASDDYLLQRLDNLFKNPPSYIQSFLVNLSRKKWDTRNVARNIKQWAK